MIPLTPDPVDMPRSMPDEPCCFCGKGARTWYEPRDVAVCETCAETRDPSEVPSKTAWCAAVDAATERTRLTPKAYRAQETRWRFLSVCTRDNEFYTLELENRTRARAFAEHLVKTGAARKVGLIDKNHADSGFGWAS